MAVTEVVVGSTRKTLKVVLLDEDNAPLNITGATVKLQGTSPDLPGVTIDDSGTIYDGPNGVAAWASLGSLITTGELAGKASALFNLRVKLTIGGLIDYGPLFQLTFYEQPV